MMKRLVLRSWRVTEALPSGLFVWFDPEREAVELYELDPQTKSGVREACEREDQESDPSDPVQVNLVLVEDDLPF